MSAIDEPDLPPNSRVILDAVRRVLQTPVYVQSDDEHRAWRILLSVSGSLHSAGVSGFVSAGTLHGIRRIHRRNREIQRQYNGRNLHELADKYGLCARQIRRIACDPTPGKRRKKKR